MGTLFGPSFSSLLQKSVNLHHSATHDKSQNHQIPPLSSKKKSQQKKEIPK
jgi:hypothetical protein